MTRSKAAEHVTAENTLQTEERRELLTSGSASVTEKLHLPLAKSPKLPPPAEPLPNAAAAKDNGLRSASGRRPLAGPADPRQLASLANGF